MLKKVVVNIYDLEQVRDKIRIDEALEDLVGIREWVTNYEMQQITVVFDSAIITLKEIATQIRQAGYDVELDDE